MGEEQGFEYKGVFYPWHVTTTGKDLLLIDRISGMPPQEFFALVEDSYDMSRSPVTLALIATAMRNRHREWSLERIVRTVMDLDIESDEFVIIGGDEEEAVEQPDPSQAGITGRSDTRLPASNGSAATGLQTSPATPDSSGSRGSATGSPATPATA